MIAPSPLRALLGAALCCAPVLASVAADASGASQPPAAPAPAAGVTGIPVTGLFVDAPCAASAGADAPMLLAAAAPPGGGSSGAPAPEAAGSPAAVPGNLHRHAFKLTGDVTTDSDHLTSLADGQTVLTGDVDVHMGEREMQADRLIYDRNTNSMNVSGQVRFHDPTVQVQGDTGHYGDDGALFSHAQFQFLKLPGYGAADQISMTPDNVVTLHNVTYTTCPRPRADWMLHARELQLDSNAGVGVGRGAVVDFQGIPIIYLPWISFPLSEARKSGFLFPEFSTSSLNGVEVATPYYWNIAPDQDATITPTYYSLRGLDLGAQYRFLSERNAGSIDADYLYHDQAYLLEQKQFYGNDPGFVPNAQRGYLRLLDRLQLGGNTRLDTHIEGVSDTEYFEDFSQGSQSTATPFLARDIALVHRDDIWNLRAETLGFQTLDNTLPDYEHPYMQLPRLNADALWSPQNLSALTFGFNNELVNFSRDCHMAPGNLPAGSSFLCPPGAGLSGWRFDAKPQVGLDISAPGYFFRPNVAWEYTQYQLRDAPVPDNTPQRSLPIVSVDTGLEFERPTGTNGVRTTTLEPRVMYVYIPYRDQSQLPIFDTASPDLNLIEMFQPNRYVGVDRIGDANQLTMGLTSQTFETASGVRYLSATIGQSLYLQAPRVNLLSPLTPQLPPQFALPDAAGIAGTTTSSLIAETNLTAYKNWNLQVNVASNPAVTRTEEAEVVLQYLASARQVANLSYRYLYGQMQQIDGSEAWKIDGHWELYARAVFSMFRSPATAIMPAVNPSWIEDFAGFQYRGACWSIRVVAQRAVTTRTGQQDSGVSLQLELTGLSNVGSGVGTGSGLTTFLEQSIRGYSATAPKP